VIGLGGQAVPDLDAIEDPVNPDSQITAATVKGRRGQSDGLPPRLRAVAPAS
jgi:hypothetical protein